MQAIGPFNPLEVKEWSVGAPSLKGRNNGNYAGVVSQVLYDYTMTIHYDTVDKRTFLGRVILPSRYLGTW